MTLTQICAATGLMHPSARTAAVPGLDGPRAGDGTPVSRRAQARDRRAGALMSLVLGLSGVAALGMHREQDRA